MVNSKLIDHTLLKAFATEKDIKKLCDEAIEYIKEAITLKEILTGISGEEGLPLSLVDLAH